MAICPSKQRERQKSNVKAQNGHKRSIIKAHNATTVSVHNGPPRLDGERVPERFGKHVAFLVAVNLCREVASLA